MRKPKIKLISVGKLEWYMHQFFSWVVKTIQKHRLDGGGMLIPGHAAETLFTAHLHKKDEKLLKAINKQITSQRRTLKTHFEDPEMGWDLDVRFIIDDILTDLFKFNVTDYILGRLVRGRPIDVLFTSGKVYLTKRKESNVKK